MWYSVVYGFIGNIAGIPPTERNPGFLDEHAPLSWIQKNIAAYDGEPKKYSKDCGRNMTAQKDSLQTLENREIEVQSIVRSRVISTLTVPFLTTAISMFWVRSGHRRQGWRMGGNRLRFVIFRTEGSKGLSSLGEQKNWSGSRDVESQTFNNSDLNRLGRAYRERDQYLNE